MAEAGFQEWDKVKDHSNYKWNCCCYQQVQYLRYSI